MRQPQLPIQAVLYILGALIGAVIGFAIVQFMLGWVFSNFATIGHNILVSTNTQTSTTDLIETFLLNAITYMAIIGLIVFGIAAWQYSQRKGVVVEG